MILRKELIELSFEISSEEHERRRTNGTYTDSLLSLLNAPNGLINRCMKSLSKKMFACLMQCYAYTLSGILLKVYKSKVYNGTLPLRSSMTKSMFLTLMQNTELGALTLQADLRKIVDGMNNLLEEGSVRSQVEELQIFVWLLNIERPSDVEDSPLIKKSSMAKEMSSTDIGEILSLRVEMHFLKEVERLYKVSSGIDRLKQTISDCNIALYQ